MVYALLSGPVVHTIFSCFPKEMVYTFAFFALRPRGVSGNEGGGTPRRWCILCFPLVFDATTYVGFGSCRKSGLNLYGEL